MLNDEQILGFIPTVKVYKDKPPIRMVWLQQRHVLQVARAVEAEVRVQAGAVPLTRQQLREAFYNDTACTLGGDVDLAEKICRVVEKAHGIKQGGV